MKKIRKFIYEMAKKYIVKTILNSDNKLTPSYLMERGWVMETDDVMMKLYYVEKNIKDRDKIYIDFESYSYRIWHSDKKTFITGGSSIELFEMYYLLAHPDNRHAYIGAVASN